MAKEWTYDLFISYAEADKAWVEGYLLDALEKAEVRCTSESAFALGVPRISEFERAIRQSQATLLVISEAYLADSLTEFTDILAQSYGAQVGTWPVIPLTLEAGLQLPPRLKMLEGLKVSSSEQWETAIERLCHQLKRPLPLPSPKPACPYPGMIPFSENDERRFFGRDDEIEELLERLRLNPFLTVIGSSGSGKSSLIFAGLIPKLKQSGLFGTGQWCIRNFRPGTNPLANLQAVLGGDVTALEVRIQQLLSTQPDAQRLLLVVDQFEELFTQAGVEATPFQQALLKLIEIPNVYLILTVRADFYADLMGSLLWEKIRSRRFEVLPLDKKGLQQAIVRPAEGVEVYVDPVLVERLVVDAKGEPGVLPLIQETLVLLWEKLERRFLPLRAYEVLILSHSAYVVTPTQNRTGLQVAIARRADAALADLETEKKQAIARRIFLRLIQFGEGRPDTRRQQSVDDLRIADDDSPLFDLTLRHLADCRLLTLSGGEDTSTKADIAHEALISGWPTLQQWITERREAEQSRRRLEAKTQDWIKLNKKGGLLDRAELEEVKRLNSSNATEFGLSSPLHELIKVSQQAAQVRKIFLGVYIVFMTGFAIFAVFQWRNAEIGQIKALTESSKAKFTSNRSLFDALLDALRAGKRLKQVPWGNRETELKADVMTALTESVFWVKEKNRLEGHSGWVGSLSFSHDGKIIASANGDNTIKLWKRDGSIIDTLVGHEKGVKSVSFHPREQILVSSSLDGTVRLWKKQNDKWKEDETWRKTSKCSKDNKSVPVRVVSFSPDGKFIAVGSDDETVKICELDDGNLIKTLKGHQDIINSLSFSPNGQIIATASSDGTIKLWKWQDSKVITEDKKTFENDRVGSVQFSPNGNYILAGSLDKGTLKLWEWNGKQLTGGKLLQNSDGVETVNFSPDGQIFASSGWDNIVKLWKLDGTLITKLIGHSNFVKSVSFSPDRQPKQQILASASDDGTVKLWQLKTQTKVLSNGNNLINGVSCSPNCDIIAAASDRDNTVKLWRPDGTLIDTLKGHTARINNISFSLHKQKIATASEDGTIKLWQLNENGEPKCTKNEDGSKKCYKDFAEKGKDLIHNPQLRLINVSFSPNDKMIAFTTFNGQVQLWQLKDDPSLLKKTKAHETIAFDVSFSPNEEMLASAGGDGIVKLWKTDGTMITKSEKPNDRTYELYKVRFNLDSNMIAAASQDGSVKLWKIKGKGLVTIPELSRSRNNSPVIAVSFSPKDKQMLASANDKGTIFIWKLDGTFITELNGHSKYITSLNFSSDGKTLVSGSDDASIILWNLDEWNLDNLSLDHFMLLGCSWIQDYLKTNPNVDKGDRHLCDVSQ